MTARRSCLIALAALVTLAALALWSPRVRSGLQRRILGPRALDRALAKYEPKVREALIPCFEKAGVEYPPERVILLVLKLERELQVYAAGKSGDKRYITTYPILAASGHLGPKLKYGDCQVPEGFYEVESLNPRSRFHLALRLNYPNEFDREQAHRDGRTDPGKDIMIHGGAASIGCVAIGDDAIEEVFKLAADTETEHMTVLLSPVDFRLRDLPPDTPPSPDWVPGLYDKLRKALAGLPQPPPQ